MTGILEGLRALAEFLGLIRKRQELNNTEEMKKADLARKQTEKDNQDVEAIKKGDEKAVRGTLSN